MMNRESNDMDEGKGAIDLSIIIPVFNEENNIRPLYHELLAALAEIPRSYEILFVDDGSRDSTAGVLSELAARDARVKVITFRRNLGQTAAISAGIDYARGDVLIAMDGDLQNDPYDIKRLLEKMDEGYDVVSGWRKNRKDRKLARVLPSWFANKIISALSGVDLHDYGCTLKAYKRDVIKGVRLYGEMHRFIPIYASWHGASVAEIIVNHRPRIAGQSKYGFERVLKVILDLIVIKFLGDYAHKPIYIFGTLGMVCFAGGFLAGLYAVYLKFVKRTAFIATPLPLLTVLLFVLGFSSILMGLIAELSVRTYYESQNKPTYLVKETKNIPPR
jgi:glycosyltransferase involved in cell wall biosynthesis